MDQYNEELVSGMKSRAEKLAAGIDHTKPGALGAFGAAIQARLLPLTRKLLEHVGDGQILETGDIIRRLHALFAGMELEIPSGRRHGISRLFRRRSGDFTAFYRSAVQTDEAIGQSAVLLERSANKLMAETIRLGQLLEENTAIALELDVHEAAAELKLKYIGEGLQDPEKSEAEREGLSEAVEVLESRLYELRISKEIARQNRELLLAIQRTNKKLTGRIQSAVITAIPLWRNQASVILELLMQREALQKSKEAIDRTDRSIEERENKLPQEAARWKALHGEVLSLLDDTLSSEAEAKSVQAETSAVLRALPDKRQ